MANILDYLDTNFKTFEEAEFNPVDSLILSAFCMVELDEILEDMPGAQAQASPDKRYFLPWKKKEGAGLKFSDVMKAEHYNTMFKGFIVKPAKECLVALAASPRFRDMTIHSYRSILDHDFHIQFAATTFIYKDQFAYVGFRGTDTSVAGWREDFDMACSFPVPAQDEALHFLEQTIDRLPKNLKHIYVGGHSKGANLAVYSSMFAPDEIQSRITRVFDHDGPGFRPGVIPQNAPVIQRIHKTIPQDSIVGVLMTSPAPYHALMSSEKGIMQHDAYTWQVDGDDFVYLDDISDGSRLMGKITERLVQEEDASDLSAMVELLFNVIDASGAEKVPEITSDWKKTIPLMIAAASNADEAERETAKKSAKALYDAFVAEVKKNITA